MKNIDWDKNDIEINYIKCWGDNLDGFTSSWTGGFVVGWQKPNCGFGELSFHVEGEKLHCHSENMSRPFIKQVLEKIAEEVVIDEFD